MDKGTQHYIEEERTRCLGLVKMLYAEPAFLMYCIKAPVHPTEDIASHRVRFGEFDPEPEPVRDDVEDLM